MTSIAERYRALVLDRRFQYDPAQAELARKLDALAARLKDYRAEPKPSAFARLMGLKSAEPPRGLYVHGAVGRGKTMLMDMFFDAVETPLKRRAHFHAFMADVHARLHQWRQALKRGEVAGEDPIAPVAAELAREASLLCFDEFSVRDIADAMILSRLFTALFAAGVVVVATSNVAPDDLYRDGLNRALFLPFIALIEERLDVVELDARTDYRLEKLKRAPVYYTPLGPKADAALDAAFLTLTGHDRGEPVEIELLGRHLDVPQAIDGVARFDFDALLPPPARLGRLSQDRPALSHPHHRPHPGARRERAQRGQAVHHPDRRALRYARQADRLGRRRAGDPLCRRRRRGGVRIRPHRLASLRDALGRLSRAAARSRSGSQAGDLGGIAET